MSVDYAAGLSHYDDLGVCGLEEVLDDFKEIKQKVRLLASLLRQYNGSCLVHVGAGLSTSAGIPDFRGKSGVWTKLLHGTGRSQTSENINTKSEKSDQPAKNAIPFDETKPTTSHMILREMCHRKHVRHIVSQNVDGLFLKSNLPRNFLSELHGNFYLDECGRCRSRFIRQTAAKTMRLQRSSIRCLRRDKDCTGYLRDTILDWESPIPYNELRTAQRESKLAKLHICIGSTMQLRPAKDLVGHSKKNRDKKLVIINLQPTEFDKVADLVIHYYADVVMTLLAEDLGLDVPTYSTEEDPTKQSSSVGTKWEKM